jgi:membrane protease YdiL (CAAX protease family)
MSGTEHSPGDSVLHIMDETAALNRDLASSANPSSLKSRSTWVGLFFSLFGMLLIRQAIRLITPAGGVVAVTVREAIFLASAGALLLVTRFEKLPLTSVGLGTSPWWKSVGWGLVISVICAGLALMFIHLTGFGKGPTAAALGRLPLWLVTVMVFRAGIMEELFYRGYAIERLQSWGLGRWAAAIIPLAIFSVGHWTGGAANILVAAVLGGVLTLFYLWRCDLVANILAHVLVDFVGNVVPRLFS